MLIKGLLYYNNTINLACFIQTVRYATKNATSTEAKIDKRLYKRGRQLYDKMLEKKTVVINKLSKGRSEIVGLCRYLKNEKVTMDKLISEQTGKLKELSSGKHVLLVNDTSEVNFEAHSGYLSKTDKELGPVGNNKDIGFFLHAGLVIDAATAMPLGFSSIHIWNRQWDKTPSRERVYHKLPIEEKESFRWIDCAEKGKQALCNAATITVIADRESDIYEEFARVPDSQVQLLIRSKSNRCLMEGGSLHEKLMDTEACHSYKLKVRTSKNHTGRDTVMEVKFTEVKIKRPSTLNHDKSVPDYITLMAVEAKEAGPALKRGEKPIHWILLTTHEVTTREDAMQIIAWYAMRWNIELLFSTLKTAGLDIEASEIESGAGLKKLCVIALSVALQINQLRQARLGLTEIPATIIFTPAQIAFIKLLIPEYEGKTVKQTNRFKEGTLAWAAWLIARLGGWKGYDRESPPGNKTFKWGLDYFNAAYQGYKAALKLCA